MANGRKPSSELEMLKRKVQILEDKEAIRDVLARYAFNVDLGRIDNFLKLWTDDCTFITDGAGFIVNKKGKDEIRAYLLEVLPESHAGSQHLQLDYVISIDGDTAIATGYQLITGHRAGSFGISRCALRTFRFRRVDGAWLIEEAISRSITEGVECQKLIPTEW